MSSARNRWMAVILVASLVINIGLIGYVVGLNSKSPPTFDPTRGFAIWTRTLPDERRRELRGLLREYGSDGQRKLRRLMRKNSEMQAALLAVPFDPEQLAEVLANLRQQGDEMQVHSHGVFVKLVSQLSDEERILMAEDLQARRHKHRQHRFGMQKAKPTAPPPASVLE